MMNDLKLFSNSEFGELGVLMIDGKEWFPATQCAKILGYKNPQEAVRSKCKGVSKFLTPSAGGTQEANYISESDLFRLIVSSKLPEAEKFEKWVFEEVLPSIRKNGSYGDINIEQVIAQTATAVVSEVVKQLVPVLTRAVCTASHTTKNHVKSKAKKYCGEKQPSKMEMLPPEIKERADEMLCSGKYSCQQVANYVINSTGQYISQVAVSRYKRNHFTVEETQLSFLEVN